MRASWSDIPQLMMSNGTSSNSRRGSKATTSDDDDNNNLESVIADAMKQLSMDDREKVVHSIHGVADTIEETSDFVEQKLIEMNNHLIQIKLDNSSDSKKNYYPTAAIELAESISSEYVENSKFRLQFLRTENYNTKDAAIRMVYHFDSKFSLFGGSKLCKDITYDDLDQYDKEALDKGFLQVLPVRDRAGRIVCCLFPDKQRYNANCVDIGSCFGRICWYTNTILDDNISRSKGVVFIIYNVGTVTPQYLYPQCPPVAFKLIKSQPVKFVSMHMCFSNSIYRIVLENFLKVGGGNIRTIAKIHQGSQQEVMYNLMTYGIPTDMIPVNFDNEIKRTNHLEHIKMMKIKEEYIQKNNNNNIKGGDDGDSSSQQRCIVVPYIQDVLFGKGGPTTNSPGNMRLKSIVDELLPMYNNIEKDDKIELSNQVLACIKESGGRFLNKETGVWLVVDDKISRSKVATLFRNRRKAAAKKLKQQNSTASDAPTTTSSSSAIKSPIPRSSNDNDNEDNRNIFLSSSSSSSSSNNATALNNGNKRLRI